MSQTTSPQGADHRDDGSVRKDSTFAPRRSFESGRKGTPRRVVSLVAGTVLCMIALILLATGGLSLWEDRVSRDSSGFVSFPSVDLATEQYAIVGDLRGDGPDWLYGSGVVGDARVRATSQTQQPLFIGIARTDDVFAYLGAAGYATIDNFEVGDDTTHAGGTPSGPPSGESIWATSTQGTGQQTLLWEPRAGDWSIVFMNADAGANVNIRGDLSAELPPLPWLAGGLLITGVALGVISGLLIRSGVRAGDRSRMPPMQGAVMNEHREQTAAPEQASTPAAGVVTTGTDVTAVTEVVTPTAGTEDVTTGTGGVAPGTDVVTIKQYSLMAILAIWAAAALPMGALAWIVAPAIADGDDIESLIRPLLVCLTAGLVWQFILVACLVGYEQRTLRWSRVCEALWLRKPRSPRSGRIGGWTWLIVVPLILGTFIEGLLVLPGPNNRNLGEFLSSDAGEAMFSGAWGWYGLLLTLLVFNTVLGEELLFRGVLLPRMNGAFGKGDWVANGVLFAAYHLHEPWVIPTTLLDTFFIAYPTKHYQSAWIGIAVHSAQTVLIAAVALTLVV